MHHSSTSTYTPNFIEIKQTFCERTDARMYRWVDGHLRPTLLGRPKNVAIKAAEHGCAVDRLPVLAQTAFQAGQQSTDL